MIKFKCERDMGIFGTMGKLDVMSNCDIQDDILWMGAPERLTL